MWLQLAFLSAALLGLYDVAKKKAVRDNSVPQVLLLNTLFSTLFFLPAIISGSMSLGWFEGTLFDIAPMGAHQHLLVMVKAAITLSSWLFGYVGIKHLPITIVGPINATRPVIVLLGAFLIFGERLNLMQWIGVLLALLSLFLLSRAGKKEGIDFVRDRWILCVAAAALLGAVSGLYDRHILGQIEPLAVQSWFCVYQVVMMGVIVAVLSLTNRLTTPFRWSWAIPMISIFLTAADMAYFVALSQPEAMVSVVSMVRRSSVVVSFACGALLFGERNLRSKAIDLAFILVGMIFLWLGSR
ncbi:MAG: DMT family transporter [Alistipes sp.]|nr:DMT family transporter [Alistipes sp.]MBR3793453.1 DMT family transporter [Alistipes sp.]MDO5487629.1 DMT family transporter [Rikenellaceae bacterium]